MKTAIFFISYHPGSLVEYDYLARLDNRKSLTVLIICRHPYLTEEMLSVYLKRFDQVIVLPDIDYDINIIRGFTRYYKLIKYFKKEITPVLQRINRFNIISDCSAYLPVNALISVLRKNSKCRNLISIREDNGSNRELRLFPTMRALFYTNILGLYKVRSYNVINYSYVKEPRDVIIRLLSPFEISKDDKKNSGGEIPVYVIYKTLREKKPLNKNMIIFYSDRNLQCYCTDLSREEHSERIKTFLSKLSQHYRGCRIICKTHPLDKGKIIDEMRGIEVEIYNGNLTSQMHIDMNINAIRACYSIASTSLLYAASMGVPSYTIYKYLGYNGRYPDGFFNNGRFAQDSFLYHIRSMDEIGKVDNFDFDGVVNSDTDDWSRIIYTNNE